MKGLRNWDNKTWLSSKKYISSFNNFLNSKIRFNKNTFVLDMGCGRANIISSLQKKYRFKNKPIGIDIIRNKNIKKNIIFIKINGHSFLKKTNKKFDLILIKQTIHLLKKKQVIKLLSICKNKLNLNGKIIILSLDPKKNEIPTFQLMNKKLKISLQKDEKLFNLILKDQNRIIIKKFVFDVQILKTKYLQMIKNRYISTLLNFTDKQLKNGLNEIKNNYGKVLKFKDRLICFIITK